MSKIAEQKAHQFLMKEHTSFLNKLLHEADLHVEFQYHKDIENSYANGYDQAMQDFMEKAESFIENKISDYFWWNNEECFVEFDKEHCLEQFKNYMQDESKRTDDWRHCDF